MEREYSDAAHNVAAGLTDTAYGRKDLSVLIEARQLIVHGLARGVWLRSEKPEVHARLEAIVAEIEWRLTVEYDAMLVVGDAYERAA